MPHKKTRITEIDQFIANRLKILRKIRGQSQKDMALTLGMSFQQLQKYELGHNRISASTLYKLSRILGVDLNNFFKDINESPYQDSPLDEIINLPNLNKETFNLLKLFSKIENTELKKSLLHLISSYIKKSET